MWVHADHAVIDFSCSFRGVHERIKPKCPKTRRTNLDIVKSALAKGLRRLVVRTRKVRMNWWTGNVAAEETVTTVEPTDARH